MDYFIKGLNIIYSPKLTTIFYEAPRTDKCHDLSFQTVNMLLFSHIR
jgi:hypothetical protein